MVQRRDYKNSVRERRDGAGAPIVVAARAVRARGSCTRTQLAQPSVTPSLRKFRAGTRCPNVGESEETFARLSWARQARASHEALLPRLAGVWSAGGVVRAWEAARAEGSRRDRDHRPFTAGRGGALADEDAFDLGDHIVAVDDGLLVLVER